MSEPTIELFSQQIAAASETLATILNQDVVPGPPVSMLLDPDELAEEVPDGSFVYPLTLSAFAVGPLFLVLERRDAAALMDMLLGGDGSQPPGEFSRLHLDVLREAVDQLLASLPGVLERRLARPGKVAQGEPFVGSLPDFGAPLALSIAWDLRWPESGCLRIRLVMPVALAEALTTALDAGPAPSPSPGPPPARPPAAPVAQEPRFQALAPAGAPAAPLREPKLDVIMDVPLQITAVLGRTSVQIQDLISLGEGSVLELDRLAGEPVELYVQDRLVAVAEVVVIDERFGVKVLEVVQDGPRSGGRGSRSAVLG